MSKLDCIANVRLGDYICFNHMTRRYKSAGYVVGIIDPVPGITDAWFLVALNFKCKDSITDEAILDQVPDQYHNPLLTKFLPDWDNYKNYKFISHQTNELHLWQTERIDFPKIIKGHLGATTVELVKEHGEA